jgi:hypothetical protein
MPHGAVAGEYVTPRSASYDQGRFGRLFPAFRRALATLATDITRHAYRITDDHVAQVTAHGWSEAQFLEAVWVACLFNAIVRLADTLGLHRLGQLPEPQQDAHPHAGMTAEVRSTDTNPATSG